MGFVPSVSIAFIMVFITMIAWGSWANTMKKCGNWRFEGYYWDYALSLIISALLLGIVLGGVSPTGWSPFNFFTMLQTTTFSAVLWSLFAGFVWGLGNIFIVAAIALAGFAVGFPIAAGLALVLGTILAYITNPSATSNPIFLFIGLFFVTVAIIANGIAYRLKGGTERHNAAFKRGIIVSILSGILISLFGFPFNFAFETGMTPYAGAFFLTIGSYLATLVLLPILMKKSLLPNQASVTMKEYTRAPARWHLWSAFGAFVWMVGLVFYLVVAAQPQFSVAVAYTMGQCATMVSAIWGVFVWKEFAGAARISYLFLLSMFVFFVIGIIFLAQATG